MEQFFFNSHGRNCLEENDPEKRYIDVHIAIASICLEILCNVMKYKDYTVLMTTAGHTDVWNQL